MAKSVPIVVVTAPKRGIKVTQVTTNKPGGAPMTISSNPNLAVPVIVVTKGGVPVKISNLP